MRNARRKNETGFGILELLVVLTVIGLLAANVIPNVSTFLRKGNLVAANTELQNVKTAALGYYADNHVWPDNSDELPGFVSSSPRATYVFSTDNGSVVEASNVTWSGIAWSTEEGIWTKR